MVPVFGAGSEIRPGSSSSSSFLISHFENCPGSQNLKKIWLCDCQGQQVSHNFKPPILKGGPHKSILINDNVRTGLIFTFDAQ